MNAHQRRIARRAGLRFPLGSRTVQITFRPRLDHVRVTAIRAFAGGRCVYSASFDMATQITPVLDLQQVLKAEAAMPDATDRSAPAMQSPGVGPMGAGQPADAGPAGGI